MRCDVRQLAAAASQPRLRADTVIMNPPFGTRQKGVDMEFLRAAFKLSRHSVYSLHKTSTRDFIGRAARRELGAASAEVLAQLRYDLPATFAFHRAKSKDIEVDLWRFEVPRRRQQQQQQQAGARAAAPAAKAELGSGSDSESESESDAASSEGG